jgi:hypothetical protein
MIEFGLVSQEFRSLVERRRRQLSFLFSATAALTILLDGALHRHMPRSLSGLQANILPVVSGTLMVLSLVTALREARLYRGLIFNGTLYAALLRNSKLAPPTSSERIGIFNPFGVSTSLFLIAVATIVISVAFALFLGKVGQALSIATCIAASLLPSLFMYRQHQQGIYLATLRISHEPLGVVTPGQWREHLLASIDDAHRDMLEVLALVGLVTFSGFQLLSGMGAQTVNVSVGVLPPFFAGIVTVYVACYMMAISAFSTIAYVRLRIAVGHFAALLDPWDKPFRIVSIDDSFFGFIILATVFAADMLVFLESIRPAMAFSTQVGLAFGGLVALVVLERFMIYLFGRSGSRRHSSLLSFPLEGQSELSTGIQTKGKGPS